MTSIPIERNADDATLESGDDGDVYLVCQMCEDSEPWYREVSDLRTAAVIWDEHVGVMHS
jgi:hypothetical protein